MKKGFTLIELLSVIIILAIILVVAVPKIMDTINSVQEDAYVKNEEMMKKAAQYYVAANPEILPLDINSIKVISISDLKSNGYISNVVDVKNKTTECLGYVVLKRTNDNNCDATPYLKCGSNYITDEYRTTDLVNVEYLVVAGGGGGGSSGVKYAGGGGAGGLLTGTVNLTVGSQNIMVGAGGNPNNNGANSVFGTLIAIGGGAGRSNAISSPGFAGGSGGGGTAPDGIGGTGVAGQGNKGGLSSSTTHNAAGGGGGAGSSGRFEDINNHTNSPLEGGSGVLLSISGTSKWYAAGGSGGANYWGSRKNGIGGGNHGLIPISPYNQWYVQDVSIVNGSENTGSGGGGGHQGSGIGGSSDGTGGSGGSGIVIVRYIGDQIANGGTVTTFGQYTIHTFNNVGEQTFEILEF